MRREDVVDVLNDPLAQELVHSPLLARLAYNGVDGYPRVIPIGYHWSGGQFIVCTASNAPEVRALQINPKVALTVDTGHAATPCAAGPRHRFRRDSRRNTS